MLHIIKVLADFLAFFRENSQFRNSLYIMSATGVMSVFGFAFWIICSRLYTPTEIGLATSLISVASLITTFSLFGINNVIIRFLATSNDQNRLIVTAFCLASLGSVVTSGIFLIWAYATDSPVLQLGSLQIIAPIFILYVFLQATGILLEGVFISHRDAKYILYKNSLFSIIKLALPFFFTFLGAIGIVYSITGASLVAWFAGIVSLYIVTGIRLVLPSMKTVSGMMRFAFGNYLGNIFSLLPASLLPLIVTSRLGAQDTAYFYMPLMIIALINVIPSANAQSLFAEASHNEHELPNQLRRAFKHLFLILTPVVFVIVIFGHIVLGFFGPEYAETGTRVLQILAIASFVGSLNYFGDTILNIKKRSGLFIVMNTLNALIIVILSYIVAPYGLVAIAIAWLIGQIVTLFVYFIINWHLLVDLRNSQTPQHNLG